MEIDVLRNRVNFFKLCMALRTSHCLNQNIMTQIRAIHNFIWGETDMNFCHPCAVQELLAHIWFSNLPGHGW